MFGGGIECEVGRERDSELRSQLQKEMRESVHREYCPVG